MRKNRKENFYHGLLLGLLSHKEDWYIVSNAESGEGYSDILIEIEEKRIGIVIEVKYPDENSLEAGCRAALCIQHGLIFSGFLLEPFHYLFHKNLPDLIIRSLLPMGCG